MTDPKITPKSRRTRQAIEAAAKELFAQQGYEQTTVREIGARASIDASMIIRYYGSKEALFALVAKPDLRLPWPSEIPADLIGETLVRHFLLQWEGPGSGGGMPALLRSAASNETAASSLREIFASQVMPAVASIGSSTTAAQRAGLVASQLLGLALTRYVLKLPPVVELPAETIVQQVGSTIQRYIAFSVK